MNENLIVERLGRTAILTLNHPPVNALTVATLTELRRQVDILNDDPEVRALVLTGAGDQFFSPGADIELFHAPRSGPGKAEALLQALNDAALALVQFNGLTLAALNGYALGGGLSLAMACDVRIAERQIELGLPEGRLGLPPCGGSSCRLPQLVGDGWARRMALTGEALRAERALRIGLVDECVDAGFAKIVAISVADQASHTGPAAARAAKTLLQAERLPALRAAMEAELTAARARIDSAEQQEGAQAFFERRAPGWQQ